MLVLESDFILAMLAHGFNRLKLVVVGTGIWGVTNPVALGICHHQFRVVDWHRTCRNSDLGYPFASASGMADFDQSVCGGDDSVCRCLCGTLSTRCTPAGRGWPSTGCSPIPTPWDFGRNSAVHSSGTFLRFPLMQPSLCSFGLSD